MNYLLVISIALTVLFSLFVVVNISRENLAMVGIQNSLAPRSGPNMKFILAADDGSLNLSKSTTKFFEDKIEGAGENLIARIGNDQAKKVREARDWAYNNAVAAGSARGRAAAARDTAKSISEIPSGLNDNRYIMRNKETYFTMPSDGKGQQAYKSGGDWSNPGEDTHQFRWVLTHQKPTDALLNRRIKIA
jgi:hypothetical protein